MLPVMSDGTLNDRPGDADEVAITVNGETRHVPADSTVADLVAGLGLETQRVAVAVNRQIVPRTGFTECELSAGDRVEILRAVGGGM